jgi:hypothetical protein
MILAVHGRMLYATCTRSPACSTCMMKDATTLPLGEAAKCASGRRPTAQRSR